MIQIFQSEWNKGGYVVPWSELDRAMRQRAAANILRARGTRADSYNAFLLEINNPSAIESLVFVQDVRPLIPV